jgi:transposase
MPDTFPLWHAVYRWFARLRDDGTWETINHHLVMRDRKRSGREAGPTAAVIDSQDRDRAGQLLRASRPRWPLMPWARERRR